MVTRSRWLTVSILVVAFCCVAPTRATETHPCERWLEQAQEPGTGRSTQINQITWEKLRLLAADPEAIAKQKELTDQASKLGEAFNEPVVGDECTRALSLMYASGMKPGGSPASQQLLAAAARLAAAGGNTSTTTRFRSALNRVTSAIVSIVDETSDIAADDLLQKRQRVQRALDWLEAEHALLTDSGAEALEENITGLKTAWKGFWGWVARTHGGMVDEGVDQIGLYVQTFDEAASILLGNDPRPDRDGLLLAKALEHMAGVIDSGSEIVEVIVRDNIVDVQLIGEVTAKHEAMVKKQLKLRWVGSLIEWIKGDGSRLEAEYRIAYGVDQRAGTLEVGSRLIHADDGSLTVKSGIVACGKVHRAAGFGARFCRLQENGENAKLYVDFGLFGNSKHFAGKGVVRFVIDAARYVDLFRDQQ